MPKSRLNVRLRNAALAFGALTVIACAKETANAGAPAAEAGRVGEGPAMWRLADADSEIYLFGTFHILPATVSWSTPAFTEAMAETETTMTEVDTESPEAQATMAALVQQLGVNPPGVTLSSQLGPNRTAKLAAVIKPYGLQMAQLEPLKPWLAMLTISVMVMQKEGYSGDSGAEKTILARAASEKDAIAHLETAEFQIRMLANLSEDEILGDFDASLDQLADFDGYSKRMLDSWTSGDVAALDREFLAPLREDSPAAYKALIVDRNQNWAAQIDRLIAGKGDHFIAVGAGHLVGDDSVVKLLGAKGHKVERVQ
jgi:hypothetical protein